MFTHIINSLKDTFIKLRKFWHHFQCIGIWIWFWFFNFKEKFFLTAFPRQSQLMEPWSLFFTKNTGSGNPLPHLQTIPRASPGKAGHQFVSHRICKRGWDASLYVQGSIQHHQICRNGSRYHVSCCFFLLKDRCAPPLQSFCHIVIFRWLISSFHFFCLTLVKLILK